MAPSKIGSCAAHQKTLRVHARGSERKQHVRAGEKIVLHQRFLVKLNTPVSNKSLARRDKSATFHWRLTG